MHESPNALVIDVIKDPGVELALDHLRRRREQQTPQLEGAPALLVACNDRPGELQRQGHATHDVDDPSGKLFVSDALRPEERDRRLAVQLAELDRRGCLVGQPQAADQARPAITTRRNGYRSCRPPSMRHSGNARASATELHDLEGVEDHDVRARTEGTGHEPEQVGEQPLGGVDVRLDIRLEDDLAPSSHEDLP